MDRHIYILFAMIVVSLGIFLWARFVARSKLSKIVKIPLVVLAVIVSPVLMLIVMGYSEIVGGRIIFEVFKHRIYSYPLPEGAVLVSRDAHLRHPGNGSQCYSDIKITLKTILSRAQLDNHYSGSDLYVLSYVSVENGEAHATLRDTDAARLRILCGAF